MPAEWAPHERTLMAWPCRQELWGTVLAGAQEEYAAVANAVAAFEPVTMVAPPGRAAEARGALAGEIDVLALELDDSWLRDNGPIFVLGEDGRRTGVHFRFNAWGERYHPYDRDAAVGARLVEWLGDPLVEAPLVLEGGSICVDGEGTLLTTEQCLLHPTRNPTLSREEIEAALRLFLGVERVVWLGQGLLEDRDTDGHVDLVAAFTRPGQVLLQTVPEGNPNFENCQENARRLEGAGLDVIEVDDLPYARVEGQQVAIGALNLYLCNGGVIVPVRDPNAADSPALETIAAAFPDREVVAVPGTVLAYGGGGPHCITQQVPAAQQT